jgi:hypothetical protein
MINIDGGSPLPHLKKLALHSLSSSYRQRRGFLPEANHLRNCFPATPIGGHSGGARNGAPRTDAARPVRDERFGLVSTGPHGAHHGHVDPSHCTNASVSRVAPSMRSRILPAVMSGSLCAMSFFGTSFSHAARRSEDTFLAGYRVVSGPRSLRGTSRAYRSSSRPGRGRLGSRLEGVISTSASRTRSEAEAHSALRSPCGSCA